MKRLLITGYSGFVGNNLVEQLQGNYQLNLLGRKQSNFGNVFTHNLDSSSLYNEALVNIDVVVHCAARVHIMDDVASDPLNEFRAVNTLGTLNLAKQAAAAGVKRFIFLSSIKVNGESTSEKAPFAASDKSAAEDPYGISKAEAEQQLLDLSKQTCMEVVIIRPPLVYGEGVKANFASLMRFVGKGLPLPFRSIKSNKRSLVSVYNLVDLIKVCIEHPKAANQVFLASDDYDLSTAEMLALMAKVQNKKNLALPVPVWCFKLAGKLLNKSDVIDRLTGSLQLDINHTKNTLDWQPPYSVEHGFKLAAEKPLTK
ncbi:MULTISPECIES: UDP-glucose 4-epimerase family protein [unclassified Pseudoalteromonas]|uniref:UDP-glucose 4-epimerase family protein n=1 Tax=unclassified Pseudoalteromonas TaxID=194690 RepID=UPI0016040B8D|nr:MULTISPECIES: SDR family oxidoreductase [unclassified Pseudoalteromonas]MBB1335500.1 SDR family oxidoreductase [Pseudoalteromonas sp. SR41-6]MBB1461265.1 SDR family oxidoreductase [Pseudoalteromonas sp. SG41-8]